jgi:hypothetical protein
MGIYIIIIIVILYRLWYLIPKGLEINANA